MQEQNKAYLPQAAVVCPSGLSIPKGPSLASTLITANIKAVIQQVLSLTSTILSVISGKQP